MEEVKSIPGIWRCDDDDNIIVASGVDSDGVIAPAEPLVRVELYNTYF